MYLPQLRQLGYHNVDGLDASQAMLDQAVEKHVYRKVICASLGKQPTQIESGTGSD